MTTYTLPDLLPKPEKGDIAQPLEQRFIDLGDAVQAAFAKWSNVTTGVLGSLGSGWSAPGTFLWKQAGFAYVTLSASKSVAVAANGSENIGILPPGFRPPAQYLISGTASGGNTPAPVSIQVNTAGVITIFNNAATHTAFAGVFAHPVGS